MNIAPYRLANAGSRALPRVAGSAGGASPARPHRVAVVAALVLVFGLVLGPGRADACAAARRLRAHAATRPARSPCSPIGGGDTNRATLQIFLAGASGLPARRAAPGWDKHTFGKPVTAPQHCTAPRPERRWTRTCPPRLELAERRLRRPPDLARPHDYAPFVLRPMQLGTAPVLVVEPTNTWHAYDVADGDSWYLNPAVHIVDLTHPFAARE